MPSWRLFWNSPDREYNRCILCGGDVYWFPGGPPLKIPAEPLWKGIFRAVYCSDDTVKLTGVGSYKASGSQYRAPNDPTARWDTMGKDYITLNKDRYSMKEVSLVNVFLFHEQCWDHMMKHFGPEEFDLDGLYEALQYMPILPDFTRLYFDYDEFEGSDFDGDILPTIEQVMAKSKEMPTSLNGESRENPTDIFQCLPLEIREEVALYLSTRDVLNLRHISRAMQPLFFSSVFWKSRFQINSERGFLAPVIKGLGEEDTQKLDWQHLFHCSSRTRGSREFEYNIRRWEVIQWIRDAVLSKQTGQPVSHFHGRALQHYHNTLHKDTYTVSADIHLGFNQIAISAYHDMEQLHITGLEFIYPDRPNVTVGASEPGARTISEKDYIEQCLDSRFASRRLSERYPTKSSYKHPGLRVVFEAEDFRGFYVGITTSGVSCIGLFRDSENSPIVGRHVTSRRTAEYDMEMDELTQFIGTFDRDTLIDIGIRGKRRRPNAERPFLQVRKSGNPGKPDKVRKEGNTEQQLNKVRRSARIRKR